jgi:hypothetical protein
MWDIELKAKIIEKHIIPLSFGKELRAMVLLNPIKGNRWKLS